MQPNQIQNWAADADNQMTTALLAAIAAGTDQNTAMVDAAIAAVSKATLPLEAVTKYQTAAALLERRRAGGIGGTDILPKRHNGEDWVWVRVETRGTANWGRWVATTPLSARARALRGVLMDTLARLLPGFDVAFLATRSLFWERPVLAWFGNLSPEMAKTLGDRPGVESRREADEIERKGFPLPDTSIPRTAAAIAMAAEAARRAK